LTPLLTFKPRDAVWLWLDVHPPALMLVLTFIVYDLLLDIGLNCCELCCVLGFEIGDHHRLPRKAITLLALILYCVIEAQELEGARN
jgi:hypothetical protein